MWTGDEGSIQRKVRDTQSEGKGEIYHSRGSSLVISACNSPRILEEISGLDLLQASVDDIQIDVSDDDF